MSVEFINWEIIRATPEYINSVRAVLNKRFSRSDAERVVVEVHSLDDLRKFLKSNNFTITYDEVLTAADADYKGHESDGELNKPTIN